MTRRPAGQLLPTSVGSDLVLRRTFRAPIEDVWASVTESDRTARWFGPWRGHAAPGRTIEVRMAFEDQAPWSELRMEACEPPRRLAVSMVDDAGKLPVIAEAFRPADGEVARARELLAAVADAQTRDSGTVVLPDGRFADRAMVAAARRVVDLAARYAR